MDPTIPTELAVTGCLPLDAAIELQDELMTACNDLDRLQRLLAGASAELSAGFHGACALIAQHRDSGVDAATLIERVHSELARAVTGLQFEDMASQLIEHTRRRLRSRADRLAADALDDGTEAFVEPAPTRANPVTQDELDAGSAELF